MTRSLIEWFIEWWVVINIETKIQYKGCIWLLWFKVNQKSYTITLGQYEAYNWGLWENIFSMKKKPNTCSDHSLSHTIIHSKSHTQ